MTIDLAKLAEPFHQDDIEWRVSRSGMGKGGIYCMVLAYITARAIQKRLDDVCGPENWRTEEPQMIEVDGKCAFAVGIAIRNTFNKDATWEWITKWDVAEPTNIEPAKGGFSAAMKRSGGQWGIGRYLYYLDETFAEVAEELPLKNDRRWRYAKLADKHGGGSFYWKTPSLPGWALPKEPEHEVSLAQLNGLKKAWMYEFCDDLASASDLREGFQRFVASVVGDFPISDHKCWTRDAWVKCDERINATTEPGGVSADVPFEDAP